MFPVAGWGAVARGGARPKELVQAVALHSKHCSVWDLNVSIGKGAGGLVVEAAHGSPASNFVP
eukprot:1401322-Rhodomonas_salina.1